MLKKTSDLMKDEKWLEEWDSVVNEIAGFSYIHYRHKKCCKIYPRRIAHWPCDDDGVKETGGEDDMVKSDAEFDNMKGVPKSMFSDPNSLTQKILRTIPATGAVTAEELAQMGETKGADVTKIKSTCKALCKAGKKKKAKLEVRHDANHVPYFRKAKA